MHRCGSLHHHIQYHGDTDTTLTLTHTHTNTHTHTRASARCSRHLASRSDTTSGRRGKARNSESRGEARAGSRVAAAKGQQAGSAAVGPKSLSCLVSSPRKASRRGFCAVGFPAHARRRRPASASPASASPGGSGPRGLASSHLLAVGRRRGGSAGAFRRAFAPWSSDFALRQTPPTRPLCPAPSLPGLRAKKGLASEALQETEFAALAIDDAHARRAK